MKKKFKYLDKTCRSCVHSVKTDRKNYERRIAYCRLNPPNSGGNITYGYNYIHIDGPACSHFKGKK